MDKREREKREGETEKENVIMRTLNRQTPLEPIDGGNEVPFKPQRGEDWMRPCRPWSPRPSCHHSCPQPLVQSLPLGKPLATNPLTEGKGQRDPGNRICVLLKLFPSWRPSPKVLYVLGSTVLLFVDYTTASRDLLWKGPSNPGIRRKCRRWAGAGEGWG